MKGSIKKRGKSWRVVLDLPRGPGGERRQLSKTFPTKREAEAALPGILLHHQAGEVDFGRVTVSTFLKEVYLPYAATQNETNSLSTVTYNLSHWQPLLGGLTMAQLDPIALRVAISKLPANLADATRRNAWQALKTAIGVAVREGYLSKNPCERVGLPKRSTVSSSGSSPERFRVWTDQQMRQFLSEVREYGKLRHYALFAVAFGTGMRIGELLGLSWQSVEFKQRQLRVIQALHWSRPPESRRWWLGSPKTRSSVRTIEVDEDTMNILKEYQSWQLKRREMLGDRWKNDSDLVFANPDNGQPYSFQTVARVLDRVANRLGLPHIRVHDMRHTHATLLLEAGIQVKVVSERLGHASVRTTLEIYTHVLPTMQATAVKAFHGLMYGKRKRRWAKAKRKGMAADAEAS